MKDRGIMNTEITRELRIVLDQICYQLRITKDYFYADSRKAQLVDARRIYCYLAKKLVKYSTYGAIGSFGWMDHATVYYHVRRAREIADTNRMFRSQLNQLDHACKKSLADNKATNTYTSAMNYLGQAYLFNIEVNF